VPRDARDKGYCVEVNPLAISFPVGEFINNTLGLFFILFFMILISLILYSSVVTILDLLLYSILWLSD
jgi:fluoride ion exporter CrcB/FEX